MNQTTNELRALIASWRTQNGDYPESKRDCADELEALIENAPEAAPTATGTPESGRQDANPAPTRSPALTAGDVDAARQPATFDLLRRSLPVIAFAYDRGLVGTEEIGREIEAALARHEQAQGGMAVDGCAQRHHGYLFTSQEVDAAMSLLRRERSEIVTESLDEMELCLRTHCDDEVQ